MGSTVAPLGIDLTSPSVTVPVGVGVTVSLAFTTLGLLSDETIVPLLPTYPVVPSANVTGVFGAKSEVLPSATVDGVNPGE